jgi:uncharacterized cupredoxin-like copper-binding protein
MWTNRRVSAVAVVVLAVLAGGCANGAAPVMMGQPAGSAGASANGDNNGNWTMGSGNRGYGNWAMGRAPHGYQMSRLTCAAPSSLPGTTVYVVLGDMGMSRMMGGVTPVGSHAMLRAVPADVPAGSVSLVVGNMGWRTHEMVVLPLAPSQKAGQRVVGAGGRVDETGSLGEASASCAAGSGEGIKAGTVGWVTLDLAPGRYEVICNLRNHYANGMYQLLVVT